MSRLTSYRTHEAGRTATWGAYSLRAGAACIAVGTLVLLGALAYFSDVDAAQGALGQNASSPPAAPVKPVTTTLVFSETPQYNQEFTTTISITPTIGAIADVQFAVPDGLGFQSASPQPDVPSTIVSSTTKLIWEDEALTPNTSRSYTVTLKPVGAVRGWIDARVLAGDQATDIVSELGSDTIAVLVTASGGKLSDSGDGVFLDESVANSELLISESPLEVMLLWDELPEAGDTATASAVVTNVTGAAVSYDGEFHLPYGWSVEDGSATWSESLGIYSTSTHTVTVEAADNEGAWSFPVVLDLQDESHDTNYIVRQLGRFDSEGIVWVEGQERVRNGDSAGTSLLWNKPDLVPHGTDELAAIGAGLLQQQPCPGYSSGNPVYLDIDVDAAGSPASQLSLKVFWFYGNTSTPPSRSGADLHGHYTRLDDSGQRSICINVPAYFDYVYVNYFVSTTDEAGVIYEDWSTRVYADLRGRRSVRSANSGLRTFQPGPQPVSFDTDIEDTGADPYPFRLAAIHARYTRSFMSSGPGINIRGDGVPGTANAEYRVLAWANASTGCGTSTACAPAPHYIIYPEELSGPLDDLYLTAHHEYGHTTEYWLKGMPSCYFCGSTKAWIEGWADGIAAPADDLVKIADRRTYYV